MTKPKPAKRKTEQEKLAARVAYALRGHKQFGSPTDSWNSALEVAIQMSRRVILGARR